MAHDGPWSYSTDELVNQWVNTMYVLHKCVKASICYYHGIYICIDFSNPKWMSFNMSKSSKNYKPKLIRQTLWTIPYVSRCKSRKLALHLQTASIVNRCKYSKIVTKWASISRSRDIMNQYKFIFSGIFIHFGLIRSSVHGWSLSDPFYYFPIPNLPRRYHVI